MTGRSATLAFLVAVIWGLCFVVIQASLPSVAPLLLAGLRAMIGGAVLVTWTGLIRQRAGGRTAGMGTTRDQGPRLGLPSPVVVIILALANAAIAFGAMYLAAGRAEAAVASILAGGQPLVLAVAGWVAFRERADLRTVLGLGIAMGGVVLVATTSSGETSLDGVALSLLATASPAAGTIVMRRLGTRIDLIATTSVQFLLGGVILIALSAIMEPWRDVSWSPAAIVGLIALGVVGTGVAYVVWFWLLGRTTLVQLGTALFLIPVVGVVSGILTGDRLRPVELAGILILLVGIGLVSLRRSDHATASAARFGALREG